MAGPYCFVVPLARPTGLRSSCHVISPSGMSGSSKDVLTSSHHRSYVSRSGLAAILKSIKENGLPKGTSRSSIKRARDEALPAELFTTVQLEMDDGTLKQFPCVQPILLIKHLIEVVPSFADFSLGSYYSTKTIRVTSGSCVSILMKYFLATSSNRVTRGSW